jgi:3-oxoacyl-[acyl-carrier protein] reductase
MHAYASALRPHRVTANAIAPALIESKMVNAIDVGPTENLPLGRMGRAEELWPATRMIIETEYLTGHHPCRCRQKHDLNACKMAAKGGEMKD